MPRKNPRDAQLREAGKNWNTLNDALREVSEKECTKLMEFEKANPAPRASYLLRIQARLNILRRQRERAELVAGAVHSKRERK